MGILLSDIKILQLYFKKVSIVLLILDTYSMIFLGKKIEKSFQNV